MEFSPLYVPFQLSFVENKLKIHIDKTLNTSGKLEENEQSDQQKSVDCSTELCRTAVITARQ